MKTHHLGHRGAVLASLIAVGTLTSAASAININLTYDEDETPSYDPDGSLLMATASAAALLWEDYFHDSFSITIDFSWSNLDGTTLGLADSVFDNIWIQSSPSSPWYIDTTPWDHSEFDFSGTGTSQNAWAGQTLYRDLSASQQSAWFNGSPPGLMEVGYRGAADSDSPAFGRLDLFSTVVHEMGHILGVNFDPADETWDPPASQLGGQSIEIEPDPNDSGHLAARSALMCAGCGAMNLRRLPSTTDILAVAADESWTNVDLPRQDFLGGTTWNASLGYSANSIWEGGRAPDADDTAYIRHGGGVTLVTDVAVANLLVDESSSLMTSSYKLTVGDVLTVGTSAADLVRVDGPGEIETFRAEVAGELLVRGTLTIEQLAVATGGTVELEAGVVRAHHIGFNADMNGLITGHGTIDASGLVNNDGTLAPAGGTLLLVDAAGPVLWNLDGVNHVGVVDVTAGDLTILGPNLQFDGEMRIGAGRTVAVNDASWRLGEDGVLKFEGQVPTATFRGYAGAGHAYIDGTIDVDRTGVFDIPVTFEDDATVWVNDTLAQLLLLGPVTYEGGSYNGAGIIEQRNDATVEQDTESYVRVHDFDGTKDAPTETTINPGKTLHFGGRFINTTGNDYNGTFRVNGGTLSLQPYDPDTGDPTQWNLNGPGVVFLMNPGWILRETGGTGPGGRITGSPLLVNGQLRAIGNNNVVDVDVILNPNSAVHVIDEFSEIIFAGATTYRGGTYIGQGAIHQHGDAIVEQSTTIAADTFNWDGDDSHPSSMTVQESVILTLNVDTIDDAGDGYDGTISLELFSQLHVNTPGNWRLDGELVFADVATLDGSPIDNHGLIRGVGVFSTNVNNYGTISPGLSTGGMIFANNFVQHAAGELLLEIAGNHPTQHDRLGANGSVTLAGELLIELIDGFEPVTSDVFNIINTTAFVVGEFANAAPGQRVTTADGLGSFLIHYGPTTPLNPQQVTLTDFQLAMLLGDMNGDGVVDAVDVAPFVLALTNPLAYDAQFGLDPLEVGDINMDAAFDATDVAPFVQLLVGGGSASVPEPGGLAITGFGALMMLRGRRRPRSTGRCRRTTAPLRWAGRVQRCR
ncbi:MAG: hypothetical protein WD009_12090 [Phycisphaeraceae bacterium]